MEHIVIIGNGISGITTARHVRKRSDHKITVISAESDYFWSRTALMYIYMGHMKFENTQPYEPEFFTKNRINLVRGYVNKVDYGAKTLSLADGSSIGYDKLVFAVGSKPNKFGWKGQDLDGVQGMYSYQDLQTLERNTSDHKVTRAVIVGGGLIGVELAEMMASRKIPVTFLVRENRFWGNVLPKEEGELVMRHMREHHIDLQLNSELDEVLADENGRARAVKTKDGREIECQLVGLTAGVSPNITFLKDTELEVQRGIMVNEYLETNMPNVYAVGDCANFREAPFGRRPIEQVWYTGRMQGERLAATLCGERTAYEPGFWFNSAKFFDIEYQTYGNVGAHPNEKEEEFYWEHPDGRKCIKVVFMKGSNRFKGLNVFGIRFRHEVCDRWLRDHRKIDYVMAHLKDANFDPEFYSHYEKQIVEKFNADTGHAVEIKSRSWARIFGTA